MDPSIKFVSPKGIIHDKIAEELQAQKIGLLKGHLWEQIELPLFLKSVGNPILVNLVNIAPVLYGNKVITIHDLSWKRYRKAVSWKFYYWYNFITPLIIKTSKHIFTVSKISKTDLINSFNLRADFVTIISNSVSREFRSATPHRRNMNVILSVASINYFKNTSSLIKAFRILKKRYSKKLRLLLIGEINPKVFPENDVIQLINNTKGVELLGHINDVEKLKKIYASSGVFVFVSLSESFGIPPIEAMACGCPVITSNLSALPETCGDAALFVDPHNIDEIANAIQRILTAGELSKDLIKKGYENIKRFSWKESAHKIYNLIQSLNEKG